jgi:hypothetical protein
MARNTSKRDEIVRRREHVARLRLRGLTQREIVSALGQLRGLADRPAPIVASLTTVNRDLQALESEWRARAAEAMAERKAKQLAEIDEAKRKCWADNDMAGLVRFMRLEAEIFGTKAALQVTWQDELARQGINASNVFEDLVRAAEQLRRAEDDEQDGVAPQAG